MHNNNSHFVRHGHMVQWCNHPRNLPWSGEGNRCQWQMYVNRRYSSADAGRKQLTNLTNATLLDSRTVCPENFKNLILAISRNQTFISPKRPSNPKGTPILHGTPFLLVLLICGKTVSGRLRLNKKIMNISCSPTISSTDLKIGSQSVYQI